MDATKVTPGVLEAFTAAEGLRGELVSNVFFWSFSSPSLPFHFFACPQVEARQKLMETKVNEEDKEEYSAINEDEPGTCTTHTSVL